jgi:hypothetical protein
VAWLGKAGRGVVRLGKARLGAAWLGLAGRGAAWLGLAGRGEARQGKAGRGKARSNLYSPTASGELGQRRGKAPPLAYTKSKKKPKKAVMPLMRGLKKQRVKILLE